MAQQKSDSGQQMINLLLIGLGAYLLWEFVISPMIANAQTSTAASSLPAGYCYDQNGNVIACPAGVATGTQVNTSQTTAAAPTPTTPASTTTTSRPTPTPRATQTATRVARAGLVADRSGGSSQNVQNPLGGMKGIVSSWPAGGGPSFSNFIPAGGMTFGGPNPFGSPAYAPIPNGSRYLQ